MTSEHIRIGNLSPVIQYLADGTQVAFTFPFPIFSETNLRVYLDDNIGAETGGYAVSGAGSDDGGTVTFATAPANQQKVTLTREVPIERTSDFQEGEFRAKVLNDEFDRQTATQQELLAKLNAALRLATTDDTDTTNGFILPDRLVRAGNYLSFDENGQPVAVAATAPEAAVSAFWASILDDADATAVIGSVAASILAADQNWTGSQRSPFIAAHNAALNFNDGQNFLITPAPAAGAMSVTFANLADGQGGNIVIDNASGNASGFSWPVGADFGSQGTPTVGTERVVFSYMIQGATVDMRRV